jgi:hypothetical protein
MQSRLNSKLVVIAFVLAGCVDATPTTDPVGAPGTPTRAATSTPTPTVPPTASPSPTPVENPAPAELHGLWETEFDVPGSANGTATMTLSEGRYLINTMGLPIVGSIAVRGDEIEFFDSDACDGRGTYRWSLEDGALTFTLIRDGCPGRKQLLDGATFR